MRSVHDTLADLSKPVPVGVPTAPLVPAVPIKKSVTDDYIVSLEDGRRIKSLKRYLATTHGMTPAEYRAKWGLPSDYPMVAPAYAAKRSELARTIGLGRKAMHSTSVVESTPVLETEPKSAAEPARQPEAAAPLPPKWGRAKKAA